MRNIVEHDQFDLLSQKFRGGRKFFCLAIATTTDLQLTILLGATSMNIRLIFFHFIAALLLTGCNTGGIGAGNNTGQIGYRIAEPITVTESMVSESLDNQPLAPAKLVRKFSRSQNHFNSTPVDNEEKDVFSIILEQAVLGTFIGEGKYQQPAEIAILANAFEFESSDAQSSSSRFYEFPEISGPSANEDGTSTDVSDGMKLIYFSPDVYLKQPLNFSSLPIMAPSNYSGRPVGIQVAIIELDRLSGPMKSLLSELADLGRKSGVGQTAPVLGDVALDLGSALLNGNVNNDDIVFEYRMVLYPRQLSANTSAGKIPVNEAATFQPGRYVLLRSESRGDALDWSNYRLDHNSTRLFKVCSKEIKCNKDNSDRLEEHRTDTYLVLNIVKHAAGTPEASYAHRTFNQLNQMVAAAERTDGSASLQVVTKNIKERVEITRSQAWLAKLYAQWALLKTEMEIYDYTRIIEEDGKVQQVDGSQCELLGTSELRPPMVRAELKVQAAASGFVRTYNQAIAIKLGNTNPELRPEDAAALIQRMAIYVVPSDEKLNAQFSDVSNFEDAYIKNKTGNELGSAMVSAIRNVERKLSCEELIAREWIK